MKSFFIFFMLNIVLNDLGCMFGVNVLLQNRFGGQSSSFLLVELDGCINICQSNSTCAGMQLQICKEPPDASFLQ